MWIEGIGSTVDLFKGMRPFLTCSCPTYDLICFKENATTYYLAPGYSFLQCDNYPTEVAEDKMHGVSISTYPNPFLSQTILQSGYPLQDATLKFYDSFGRDIRQIQHVSGESIVIQREGLAPGIYFLKVMQNNQLLKTEKIAVAEERF
jgi:hypothetical protein